jgi:hypothetical protein
MKPYRLALTALLVACAPPPPMQAPAPVHLTTALAPAAVAQATVQTLATRGFTVTVADVAGGTVVANRPIRAGDPDGAKALLACRWGADAIGWKAIGGAMTVTTTARATADGSTVTIVGTTQTAARLGAGAVTAAGADDGNCVSNGQAEAAIAHALTAP